MPINIPFGNKAEKKHEFPDAIMCLALENYTVLENKRISVISNDTGFKDFCQLRNELKYFQSLKEFFDHYNKESALYPKLSKYIDDNLPLIEKGFISRA